MREKLETLVRDALASAAAAGELPDVALPEASIERSRDLSHGDWACSAAMRLAKEAHMQPRKIADAVTAHIPDDPDIEKVEVAGPGFINFTLSASAHRDVFRAVREEGDAYGRCDLGHGERVNLEFVSANPTGPMHLGHGRWAALGDAMANVLEFCGYDVSREFYINDAGRQMDVFAASVSVRYLQIARLVADGTAPGPDEAAEVIFADPETYRAELGGDCYAGAYVTEIAAMLYADEGDSWAADGTDAAERDAHFKEVAYEAVLRRNKRALSDFGLEFDTWFSERDLHRAGEDGRCAIDGALDALRDAGCLYESDGATWFRTTDFGDDKDRVLVKADGDWTYFAPDIAYHKSKFDRGFTRLIDILGADHHGYVKRIQAAGSVLGHEGQPECVIGQMVNLLRDGEPVRMSKRTGEMVTFEELVGEVGSDSTRFLMLSRSTEQAIDFDIEVAKRSDATNPVYYVQYAHARICSIFRRASEELGIGELPADVDLSPLAAPEEIALARTIGEFGDTVASCARDLAPFRLTHYLQSLAQSFHQFYTNCQVITADEDLTMARLAACDATRRVLATALSLLGVSAPERM